MGNDDTPVPVYQYSSKYTSQQVFSAMEEELLVNYLLKSSRIHYGLTYVQSRKLAFDYAIRIQRKHPVSWDDNQLAGLDWMKGFMKRHL